MSEGEILRVYMLAVRLSWFVFACADEIRSLALNILSRKYRPTSHHKVGGEALSSNLRTTTRPTIPIIHPLCGVYIELALC